MIYFHYGPNSYAFSEEAFARRVCDLANRRGWTTLAQAQAAVTSMPFNAAGWLALKRTLAELIIGSINFPGDLDANGVKCNLDDDTIGTRDVATGIT